MCRLKNYKCLVLEIERKTRVSKRSKYLQAYKHILIRRMPGRGSGRRPELLFGCCDLVSDIKQLKRERTYFTIYLKEG